MRKHRCLIGVAAILLLICSDALAARGGGASQRRKTNPTRKSHPTTPREGKHRPPDEKINPPPRAEPPRPPVAAPVSIRIEPNSQSPLVSEIHLQTGLAIPRTVEAIKQFQSEHGLQDDGIVGPQTRAALNRIRQLSLMNAPAPASSDSQVLLLESIRAEAGDLPLYAIFGSDGRALHRGNDAVELLRVLEDAIPQGAHNSIRIWLSDLSSDRADAFATTLRIAQLAHQGVQRPLIRADIRERPLFGLSSLLGAAVQTQTRALELVLSRDSRSVEIVRSELNRAAGNYELSVRITDSISRLTYAAVAKTKDLADAFFAAFMRLLSLSSAEGVPVADVAKRAKEELQRTEKITDEDLRIELQDELGRTQIVILGRESPSFIASR